MVKKYGNYGGDYASVLPTNNTAPGGWVGSEVNRQRTLNAWPSYRVLSFAEPGDIVFAVSSGVVETLASEGLYLVPSGQEVSRSVYSDLFTEIGITFGSGDGSTTFNLPNLNQNFERCFKCTTVSGQSVDLVGSGVVPSHSHSIQGGGLTNTIRTTFYGSPPGYRFSQSYTASTSFDGSDAGNAPKRHYLSPVISTQNQPHPVGVVFCSILDTNNTVISNLPDNAMIPSGQALSRTDFASLFNLIQGTYGPGDGVSTFDVPDLRGSFISFPYPDLGVPSGSLYSDEFASHKHTASSARAYNADALAEGSAPGTTMTTPATTNGSATGVESRPTNFSAVYCLIVS